MSGLLARIKNEAGPDMRAIGTALSAFADDATMRPVV
jgi:hypothetical protein